MAFEALAQNDSTISRELFFANIPFLDLKAQFGEIRDELLDVVTRVLESQHFILGPEVDSLEREIAEYVGAEFAIGCASGSDALLLALMAIGIQPEDEVITSPFTFGATAGSVARLNGRPVFVDIHPDTFNFDERQLEAAITSRSRAIIPIHLFGLPVNMGDVLEVAGNHHLAVIEDAAQAIGARWEEMNVGNLGTCGCFSFFPSKNLGGAGDGGMITTNDRALAGRLIVLPVAVMIKWYAPGAQRIKCALGPSEPSEFTDRTSSRRDKIDLQHNQVPALAQPRIQSCDTSNLTCRSHNRHARNGAPVDRRTVVLWLGPSPSRRVSLERRSRASGCGNRERRSVAGFQI